MRIVSWNIRAGGGVRAAAIAEALLRWDPGLVALSEFRGTPPSAAIIAALAEGGLEHTWAAADPRIPGANALAIASAVPFRRYFAHRRPDARGRWLAVQVATSPALTFAAVHIPNEVTRRKWPYMAAVLEVARAWQKRPAMIIGDTNSGRPLDDEESPVFGPRYTAWFDAMEALGWRDAFRYRYPGRREFTWYSPNGRNGFRLDQAFVSRPLLPRLTAVQHAWAESVDAPGRRDALSDHAALIVDLDVDGGA